MHFHTPAWSASHLLRRNLGAPLDGIIKRFSMQPASQELRPTRKTAPCWLLSFLTLAALLLIVPLASSLASSSHPRPQLHIGLRQQLTTLDGLAAARELGDGLATGTELRALRQVVKELRAEVAAAGNLSHQVGGLCCPAGHCFALRVRQHLLHLCCMHLAHLCAPGTEPSIKIHGAGSGCCGRWRAGDGDCGAAGSPAAVHRAGQL